MNRPRKNLWTFWQGPWLAMRQGRRRASSCGGAAEYLVISRRMLHPPLFFIVFFCRVFLRYFPYTYTYPFSSICCWFFVLLHPCHRCCNGRVWRIDHTRGSGPWFREQTQLRRLCSPPTGLQRLAVWINRASRDGSVSRCRRLAEADHSSRYRVSSHHSHRNYVTRCRRCGGEKGKRPRAI